MASTTIDIYANFLVDKDEMCLWAEQVRLQNKRVDHLILDRTDHSNLSPAEMTQAVLRDVDLKCNNSQVFLDIAKFLPTMNIQKARFETCADVGNRWYYGEDPVYLGEDELELAQLLRKANFVFKQEIRFGKEEWEYEKEPDGGSDEEVHILSLPREILDGFVRYLDSKSMLRFCRAVPQLNEYADTVFDVVEALDNRPSLFWPDLNIYREPRDLFFIPENEILVTRLGALVSRFNGVTDFIGTFGKERIPQVCAMASKTINLYMNFLLDKDQVCLWAEQVLLQRKHVRRLALDCVDRSNIGISRFTQAVTDCNPEELFCESSDIELKHLNQCSRFRCLTLVITECNPEKLALSSIILELHHLKELDLKCRDVEKKQFLDVSRILTGTGICKVRFELEESIEDFNDPEWGEEKIPVYLGDNELELAAVLKSQGFSFRASLKLRNTDEDDPEEWYYELGFWHRIQ
ncbi:hypothetical protein HDU79_006141 [Rhizoclosmatium sp. JEL0117]|nr:hypothetical protein HDU79_006141 [Rhizoclosmatium sp. JEL0117]